MKFGPPLSIRLPSPLPTVWNVLGWYIEIWCFVVFKWAHVNRPFMTSIPKKFSLKMNESRYHQWIFKILWLICIYRKCIEPEKKRMLAKQAKRCGRNAHFEKRKIIIIVAINKSNLKKMYNWHLISHFKSQIECHFRWFSASILANRRIELESFGVSHFFFFFGSRKTNKNYFEIDIISIVSNYQMPNLLSICKMLFFSIWHNIKTIQMIKK